MNAPELQRLLADVRAGTASPAEASDRILAALREAPFEALGFARVDTHREWRQGFPEVILGIGKTPAQIAAIAARTQPSMFRRSSRAGTMIVTSGASASGSAGTPRKSRERRTRQIVIAGPMIHGDAASSATASAVTETTGRRRPVPRVRARARSPRAAERLRAHAGAGPAPRHRPCHPSRSSRCGTCP